MSAAKTIQNEILSYTHYDKFIEPGENIKLKNSTLKWYNIAKEDETVPDEIYDLARKFLEKESADGNLKDFGNLGFVILHRCGTDFYFLLAQTWRNGNELWESIYTKNDSGQKDFEKFSFENHHHATFCVWELAAVWYEQQTWKRFLLSGKSTEDELIYLQDKYRGKA